MKRLMVTFLCLVASYSFTQARVFQFGPRLGISNTRIIIQEHKNHFTDVEFVIGYQGGVMARLQLPIVYLQPELLLVSFGATLNQQAQAIKLKYTKLELPVLVGTSFLGLLRIQAGPTASLLLSAKEGHVDTKANYKHLSLGYQVGVGLDIWRVMVDLKYEGSLTRFGDKLAGIQTDHRPQLFILAIGFNFL